MCAAVTPAHKPSQILPYLYLGGKAEAKSKDSLVGSKIKYILNCTPPRSIDKETGCPNFYEKENTFKYQRVPIFDNRGEDILVHLELAFRFIEEGKHYGGVLVHCHKGISRSASFVIAYLMRYNEMTFTEALGYVQSVRPIVSPNEAFLEQLQQYEKILDTERQLAATVTERNTSLGGSSSTRNRSNIGPSIGPSLAPMSTGTPVEPSASFSEKKLDHYSPAEHTTTVNSPTDCQLMSKHHPSMTIHLNMQNLITSSTYAQPISAPEIEQNELEVTAPTSISTETKPQIKRSKLNEDNK